LRPPLPNQVFYDDAGAIIEYGSRWSGLPPEDRYSVVTHPQRFAPLHTVGDALIDYLLENYEVTVGEDVGFAGDVVLGRAEAVRAVRVLPQSDDAAALTFVFTAFPGLILHAGLLHDFPFPACGCDACDESLEREASQLEWRVLAVAEGGYSESYDEGASLPVGCAFVSRDGLPVDGGHTLSAGFPPERLRQAQAVLSRLPNGWQPWRPRTGETG
jgi:hypothetical protein